MKKYIIIFCVVVILVVFFVIIRSNSMPTQTEEETLENEQKTTQMLPNEIVVGLFEPNKEISELTKLLESRLKEIGFQTIVLPELVDPETTKEEKTTLLFRSDTQKALEVVTQEVIQSAVYRKGQNEAIEQDVIISAWNIEDINWGDLSNELEKFLHPEPVDISITVLNAGAESGAAGKLKSLLQEAGYIQTKTATANKEATRPVLIYYQRNFKEIAKDLRKLLSDQDYSNTTYRIRLDQDDDIVVVLGPEEEK